MFPRLREQGYTGSIATLKAYVHTLRPSKVGQYPIHRYETKPGEQMQYDWAEFHYEQDGHERKLYGFVAVLSYSRMRFITFVKRCDTPTMIRCMMTAFEYFDGLPKAVLTDRMKSVFLEMDGNTPIWNPVFADFVANLGIAPRVCKPYKPQTKGKVERSVGIIKESFWPGVRFTDLDDLNAQASSWCNRLNQKVHRSTLCVPLDRWIEEQLYPLPNDYAWQRYGAEERRVSLDGFISYDGVLYGLPTEPPVAGSVVWVRERQQEVRVFSQGQLIATLCKRPRSQEMVIHPDQFSHVTVTSPIRAQSQPLGHQVTVPQVETRPLAEYDHLFGVEVLV